MSYNEEIIGKNIREVRKQKGYSQEKLATLCGFSNTTLSAYEYSKKIPNLITIAKIAHSLNVSIERLFYGDDSKAFIEAESDLGRKIVNCIFFLWELGIIDYYENYRYGTPGEYYDEAEIVGIFLHIKRFSKSIKRLLYSLNDYKEKYQTYDSPEQYLEIILSSVAKEINDAIL
ncbi:MAG: helix-turn-helix transcriptional regulator [Lachnospiraceae bacterium]|nr:helix-turn-helix transcriptional regulator [Lachnospiraceae bacterium]